MKSFLTLFFLLVFISTALGQMTNKLDKLEVNDLTAKKLDVVSTTSGSRPCPKMTLVQRDAIVSPLEGQCIFNSTDKKLNIFNSVEWVEVGAGGDGGIANWETGKLYNIDDVVIYNSNIYQCIEQHTSTTFDPAKFNELARDLTNATGTLKLSNGGSNKNLAASSGSVVYSDADSMEMSSVGTSGQFLKSNGASAPTWEDVSIDSNSFSGVLATSKGGTNKSITPSAGAIPYLDADSFEVLGAGTSGQFLKSNGTSAPSWGDVSVNDAGFSGVLSLGKGGTNKSITASNGAIAYSDADSLELSAVGTSGQILQSNGASAPTFVNKSISAKAGTNSSVVAEELQVSNNQLTQVDTNKHLIESNNKNILTNPSFEHSTVLTGWTNASGTVSENLVNEIHGLKALSISLSSQALNLTQDSTLYASEFNSSVQGIATAMIKTSISGVKLCARQAGVTSTSLCVSHTGSGKWELLKMPFILGPTSNGLAITSPSATGTVLVDDAFVGSLDLQATQSFDTTCDTIACQTTYSARVASNGTLISSSVNWVTPSRSAAGTYAINFLVFTVAPSCVVKTNEAGAYVISQIDSITSSAASVIVRLADTSTLTDKAFSVICQKQGADYTAAIQAQKDFQKSKVSSYSSTNADTDWTDYTPTGRWTTNTTYYGKWKRRGNMMDVQARVTLSGVPNATAISISIPSGYIIDTSKFPNNNAITYQSPVFGTANALDSGAGIHLNVAYENSTSITLLVQNSLLGANTLVSHNSPISWNTGDSIDVSFSVPILGWEQSNIVVAQLSGLESCKDSYECESTFSARISGAGLVSLENLDFINGTCSVNGTSGDVTCPFKTGVFTESFGPNCQVTPVMPSGTNGTMATISSLTNSAIIFKTNRHDAAIVIDSVILLCQKQGADYIGKTAKAVASDQNVRSIGSTGMDMQMVQFGGANYDSVCSSSPCTISFSVGSKITSVTRESAGVFRLNGIDGTKYGCSGVGVSTGSFNSGIIHDRSNSTTSYARILSRQSGGSTLTDSLQNSVTCIGIP